MKSKMKKYRVRRPPAQVTIEYLVLFSILIIVAIIVAMTNDGSLETTMTNSLTERAKTMDASAAALEGSDPFIPTIGHQ